MATYYVDVTSSIDPYDPEWDLIDGSEEHPWQSLQEAMEALNSDEEED